MVEADRQCIAVTWITLKEAQPLVEEICLSPSRAGPWLAEQIFAKPQRVRMRHRGVHPASTSPAKVESFCEGSLPTIDFADNSVTKLVVAPPGTVVGLCPVTLLGVEVVLNDIKALHLSIEPVTPEPVTPKPVAMTFKQKMGWLRTTTRKHPRQPGEQQVEYAARMVKQMKEDGITPVWSQENMKRRLRDK